jgi:hypothetical protein
MVELVRAEVANSTQFTCFIGRSLKCEPAVKPFAWLGNPMNYRNRCGPRAAARLDDTREVQLGVRRLVGDAEFWKTILLPEAVMMYSRNIGNVGNTANTGNSDRGVLVIGALLLAACSSGNSPGSGGGGGSGVLAVTGGASTSPATGGISATGGIAAMGGEMAAGGMSSVGGEMAAGGVLKMGGMMTTGGTIAASGGTTVGAGGMLAFGGEGAGGMLSMGGMATTGGKTASGGTVSSGGMMGMAGTMRTGGTMAMGGMMRTGGTMAMGGMMGMGGEMGTGGSTHADAGASCHAPGTLMVVNSGMTAYLVDQVANPTLTFCRGSTYVFSVSATGHPFYIKTVRSNGTANAFAMGVTGNGTDSGDVTFMVPASAPNTLFYDCSIHAVMGGTIHIVN